MKKALIVMLQEVPHIRQVPDEPRRRWFTDDDLDLFIWFDEKDDIVGFELCYDKPGTPRAICWGRESGYSHFRVDEGETRPGKAKATPILCSDGLFRHNEVAHAFYGKSRAMEERLSAFIHTGLLQYEP